VGGGFVRRPQPCPSRQRKLLEMVSAARKDATYWLSDS
jgi:hypothetical protein